MKIILASHTHMNGPFVVGSHHLARVFAEQGHEVLHISTAVTLLHLLKLGRSDAGLRFKLAAQGCRKVDDRLHELVPFSMLPAKHATKTNLALRSSIPPIWRVLRSVGFDQIDLLLIDQPELYGLWDHVTARKLIYRPTDIYSRMTGNQGVDEMERMILARARGVICTSQPVYEHVTSLTVRTIPGMVLENGVDYDFFSKAAPLPVEYLKIPEPRAVYVGALDTRFDWGVILETAARLNSVHFVLIAPLLGGAPSLPPNVHLLGSRPYGQLPGYLQHAQVGLLPLSDHPANQGRSPMKLYEYTAAGLPVVSRWTPELARRELQSLFLYQSPSQFGDLVEHVLGARIRPDLIATYAMAHSWKSRADAVLSFCHNI